MRYAIFSDIHANLEALEAVLAKIDDISSTQPLDQIWFLGDLVGYGPDPNECIRVLRERTDVIIAGNHDWAAVGKIDLEDFSSAARISAEWTAEQLTREYREFLADLPQQLEIGECTLVHGSPFGPLWEYLTSEALAERSFQCFDTRYCLVGHTHVPVIFIQPDIANAPTLPLASNQGAQARQAIYATYSQEALFDTPPAGEEGLDEENDEEGAASRESGDVPTSAGELHEMPFLDDDTPTAISDEQAMDDDDESTEIAIQLAGEEAPADGATDGASGANLSSEIDELLNLLGLSQSMVQVTNEMLTPPEGHWDTPSEHRAIINPGGVGQPRDGDPRAAFMIYDTEEGFEFYRVAYDFEKTQEKIIQAGLPQFLAIRLAYGK